MDYTYEFLRKCHGLRFRATIGNNPQEGIVKVMSDCVMLCYGDEDYGRLFTFERQEQLTLFEKACTLPSDFEIVPRDPETYKDWQVGDKIIRNDTVKFIIFRCGEVVLYKNRNNKCCACSYTCEEFYEHGYRLVLTDIEEQILAEREPQWVPQDGDICYLRAINKWIFIKKEGEYKSNAYVCLCLTHNYYMEYNTDKIGKIADDDLIGELRPATDEEKQKLFDALAKNGKRWNAEAKRIEDIPKPQEFKKFDPVLVRGGIYDSWTPNVFLRKEDNFYWTADSRCWIECIPLSEDTESMIGTSNNYAEEK